MNAFQRWLFPLSDTPRYTLTKFDHSLPTRIVVPLGEPFTVTARLAKDTEQHPSSARARYGSQDWFTSPRIDREYVFAFPGQQSEADILLAAGDAKRKIRVIPTLPPALESVEATITYPDYLQLEPRLQPIRSGTLPVLQGSQITLHANATRDLASGWLSSRNLLKEPSEDPSADKQNATTRGNRATYPAVPMGSDPTEVRLAWKDVLDLEGPETFRLRLDPLTDEAPVVYAQGTESQHAILPEETIEFEVLAEDDFGLQRLGLEWSGEFTQPSPGEPARGELLLLTGSPDSKRLDSPVAFSPAVHNIAPQKLTLRAFSEDYLPERGRVYSQPITLYILSRDEHAQMLKDRFDRVIGELEDAARQEQTNLDENKRIEKLENSDLQKQENQERLEKQRAAEQENIEKMDQLAERMEKLFQDALRNGGIDKDTMKKLSGANKKMRELAEQDLPEVEKQLRKAQDQRSTPEQSKKDLKEATDQQEEALKKMRQTLEEANDANNDFEAATFANRLKKAATEHDGIARTLTESLNRLIGLRPNEVDPADERVLGEVALQQERSASDVRWIQEDLAHFYARTEKDIHRELLQEMEASGISIGLEQNEDRINRNLTFRSIRYSKSWAEQLRAWAKKLNPDPNQNGGGSGGGGGGSSMEDQDFEFMLKVMKMIQTEQDIRARTRSLEQLRRAHEPDLQNSRLP